MTSDAIATTSSQVLGAIGLYSIIGGSNVNNEEEEDERKTPGGQNYDEIEV